MGRPSCPSLRTVAVCAVLFTTACVDDEGPLGPAAVVPEIRSAVQGTGGDIRVARILEASDIGVPNPSGLAFSPMAGQLLVVGQEQGRSTDRDTEVALVALSGERVGTVRIAIGATDPVNITFDSHVNRLLIFQPEGDELVEVGTRPNGDLDPNTLERHDVQNFGIRKARGMAVDPSTGHLFILDGHGPKIVRVEPDHRHSFGNAAISEIDLPNPVPKGLYGLAFDPTTRRLHTVEISGQLLHELTLTGQLAATHDVSGLGLRDPPGMAFGPSGDGTDDPAELSLYVADAGSRQIAELSFDLPEDFEAVTLTSVPASLVQTINTWQFSPPSPDPAGIAYLGHLQQLLISDSEVNEMPIFAGVNLFQMSLPGSLVDAYATVSYSTEPTGITWNPADLHLFLTDDNKRKVFEVDPGPDGLYDTPDDVITSFSTSAFGSNDPEGIAYDPAQGALFIADGLNREVYRLTAGGNGIYDGVPPSGDDQVASFDMEVHGALDLEGIAYDSDFGHLYVVGKPKTVVFHVTTSGTFVRTIDISAANPRVPAGVTYSPGSIDQGTMNLWIVDRRVDNGPDPNENDGQLYEFSPPQPSGNALPTVAVSAPASGAEYDHGDLVTFVGTASDAEDGDLTASLSWASSLDGVVGSGGTFATSSLSVGTHTITASVTDSGGSTGSDAVVVVIESEPGNGPFTVDVRVANGLDDAEESAAGSMKLTSSDLELVRDGSDQTVGMRFAGVSIPQGAAITDAYVQFTVDEANSTTTSLTIRAEAVNNAPAFSSSGGNISSRSLTASSVVWSPPPWTNVGQAGPDQRTPGISPVIQEIMNRPGWSSGNSLVIVITGTGERTAEAYNGVSSAAPLLHVEYSLAANQAPAASFTWVATDLAVDFTDASSDGDGTVVGWSWDFGDGQSSAAQNPSHSYGAAGDYTVTLTVTDDDGATGQASQTVSVSAANQAPAASFTWVATDLAVDFTDASSDGDGTVVGWSWDFGDGQSSAAQNPSHSYGAAGDYTVTLTVTDDDGATGQASQTVSVSAANQAPAASFTWVATDLAVDFTDASSDGDGTVVGWSWDFGDGQSSAAQNPSHSYGAAGDYTVTLTVTDDDGATGQASQTVSVSAANQAPAASFTWVATDLAVDFTDASSDGDGTVVGWSWDFGDGQSSAAQNPSHSYGAAGDYTVTLTVTDDDGATGQASQTVSVSAANQAPAASFTWVATDLAVDFTDASSDGDGTVVGWSWDFGDGQSSAAQNPSHSYGAAGDYTVTLTVTDDDGATGQASQTVSVSAANQAPAASFTWVATDLAVDFTDASSDGDGTVVGWSWDFGDGQSSAAQNPSHSYGAAGDYTVTLTVTDDDGATGQASQTVSVSAANQAPAASFTWVATDLAVDFTDASSDGDGTVVGWSWDFGDGQSSAAQNPSHSYGAAGDYTVTLTVTDDDGATGQASQTVSVSAANQAPAASFTWVATDLAVDFTDASSDGDGTVVGWSWDFGDGQSSAAQNPSHSYGAAGDYTVTLTVTDDDGATGQASQTVSVSAAVTVLAISPGTVAAGSTVSVIVTGTGFLQGAALLFENGTAGPRPVVTDIVMLDSDTLSATIATKTGGPKRDRVWDVRVNNADGSLGVLAGGLTITP